jgi:antitoxin VapB
MISLSPETEALAKRLADAQHLSIEDAVRQALEEKARVAGVGPEPRWPRDVSPEAIAKRRASIDRFVTEIAATPVRDPRDPREIMDDLNAL